MHPHWIESYLIWSKLDQSTLLKIKIPQRHKKWFIFWRKVKKIKIQHLAFSPGCLGFCQVATFFLALQLGLHPGEVDRLVE